MSFESIAEHTDTGPAEVTLDRAPGYVVMVGKAGRGYTVNAWGRDPETGRLTPPHRLPPIRGINYMQRARTAKAAIAKAKRLLTTIAEERK